MGCVQTKKKDDNELIKYNISTKEIHNGNIIEENINKNNNEINNKIIEIKEKKEIKDNKEYKEKLIKERRSEKHNHILSLNKVNKTSFIKEKRQKKKVHFQIYQDYNLQKL